jgi:hypothetical protein
MENDAFTHLIKALRQIARAGNQTCALAAVRDIEDRVRPRLADLPPPTPDALEREAYSAAGQPVPKPAWDLGRAEEQYGVGHLLTTLESKYDEARSGVGNSRRHKLVLRWYPAARVLRCCLAVRDHGANDRTVEWLSDALRDLPAREQAIGSKLRASGRSRRTTTETKAVLLAMAKRLKKEGTSQSEAARHVYNIDKLGTSAGANRTAWVRHARKLGQKG